MSIRSNTLFHFTNELGTLKSIIANGFWPKYCLENFEWLGILGFEKAAVPAVCFCDIPISRISEHVDFYGRYGIGLKQEWGVENHLNPVIYLTGNNRLHEAFRYLYGLAYNGGSEDATKKKINQAIRHFYGHVKCIRGPVRNNKMGKEVEKNFLLESEWRYVPRDEEVRGLMLEEEYYDPKVRMEMDAKTFSMSLLRFNISDIRYLFVDSESEIPLIIDHIQKTITDVSDGELQILISRVTALESILDDV